MAETVPPAPRVGFYEIDNTIGRGNYAVVKRCRHRLVKNEVAIKFIDKRRLTESCLTKIYREIEIHKTLDHPYIVKLYQVMDCKNYIYLVTEYAANGEMYDLVARRRLTEDEARWKFWQIISAVEYCHQKGVVHRDLKAENLLIDGNHRIKLADFGFSNHFTKDQLLATFCGSPPYAAPEVFEGKEYNGPAIDVWSLGVILYMMVCGSMPFEEMTLLSLREKVCSGRFRVPYFMTTECENLIRRMLTVNPAKRFTIAQIKSHRWMQKGNLQEKIELEVQAYNSLLHGVSVKASLNKMVELGIGEEKIMESLKSNNYDNLVGIFHLLMERYRNRNMPDVLAVLQLEHHKKIQEEQEKKAVQEENAENVRTENKSEKLVEGEIRHENEKDDVTSETCREIAKEQQSCSTSKSQDSLLCDQQYTSLEGSRPDEAQSTQGVNEPETSEEAMETASNEQESNIRDTIVSLEKAPNLALNSQTSSPKTDCSDRPRPLLQSLRNHIQFQTTDTVGSVESRTSSFSRQSTIGTYCSSIDEGVETDISGSSTSGFSCGLMGQIEEEPHVHNHYESFDSQLETDSLSSTNSCQSQSGSQNSQAEGPPALNSSARVLPKEDPSSSATHSLFGNGLRASDNTMFQSVQMPFAQGKLNKRAKGVANFNRPSTEGVSRKIENMRITRATDKRAKLVFLSPFSKRISLPENLEYQPHKFLNFKHSVEVEVKMEGKDSSSDGRFLKARISHLKKRQMNKARIQTILRQQNYKNGSKASPMSNGSGLPPRMEDGKLSPIPDAPREDIGDMA